MQWLEKKTRMEKIQVSAMKMMMKNWMRGTLMKTSIIKKIPMPKASVIRSKQIWMNVQKRIWISLTRWRLP